MGAIPPAEQGRPGARCRPRARRRGARRPAVTLAALLLLAAALAWGRTRPGPAVEPHVRAIFPAARTVAPRAGVWHAWNADGVTLGWAAPGRAGGYGGPLALVVGVDTLGRIAGARVVEQRETPTFWRLARIPERLEGLAGASLEEVGRGDRGLAAVSGATLSTRAVERSVRDAVTLVAGEQFDLRLPAPPRPFEFGLLEVTVLALFAAGLAAGRLRAPARRRLRWAAQLTGLVVLGFWKDSPITLAKLAGLFSGFLPDVRTGLAVWLLLAGFLVTSALRDRNLYCLYACPFGAAQRVVGLVGIRRVRVPPSAARLLEATRDIIVLGLLLAALVTLQPALAVYEPFAPLFSLRGETFQWVLLSVVLVASLAIPAPWCAFLCPMRTIERGIGDLRRAVRQRAVRRRAVRRRRRRGGVPAAAGGSLAATAPAPHRDAGRPPPRRPGETPC
ncbi:MAG: FMN-binding protein [Gemmatimonadota bacterium]|nr:FMN-binding protein [Gemmatimonadota bacterium]